MSTNTAFFAVVAVLALADLNGPGHQWGGLAVLAGWFLFCRWLGPRGWSRLLAAALALSVAIAALAVVQIAVVGGRARGPFASPNFLGAYAVLMFFAAAAAGFIPDQLTHGRTAFLGRSVPAAANLLTLALSQSRGALLALGAGLFVLWFRKRPALAVGSGIILGIIIAVLIRPDTTNGRLSLWHLGWQIARMRLVLGYGQGGVTISGLDHFYMIPLDVLIWGGIPALAAGVWLLAAAAKVAFEKGQPHILAFLAAWFVQGLFLSGIPATWLPLVAVLGFIASSVSDAGRISSSPHALLREQQTRRCAH